MTRDELAYEISRTAHKHCALAFVIPGIGKAIVARLDALGLVVVPREATAAMAAAGNSAMKGRRELYDADDIWSAMIRAAEESEP